jgi:hypothetical protein
MRQIFQIITIGLLTFLLACKSDRNESADDFLIPDPRLLDFITSDTNVKRAIAKTVDHLTKEESGTKMSDFYLDSISIKSDTIILMINHADYYTEWRLMKAEEKRQKELKERGDTLIEVMWVPPTGNWSGKDRAIIYLTKKDSIIDMLYQ